MFGKKPSERNNAILVVLIMGLLWCMVMLFFLGSARIQFEDRALRGLDEAKERRAATLEEGLPAWDSAHPFSGTDGGGDHWLVLNERYRPLAEGGDTAWWTEQGMLGRDGALHAALVERLAAAGADGLAAAPIQTDFRENYVASVPLSTGLHLLYAADPGRMEEGYRFLMNNYLLLGLSMLGVFALGLFLLFAWRWRDRRDAKEEKARLAWLEERYRIIARESEDVVFEISIHEKWIEANENFRKLFGYNVVKWNKELMRQVHSDDLEKLEAIYRDLKAGKRTMKDDMRIKRADGSYIWCRVLVAVLSDSGGKPVRVLGKITNIDTQKREAAWLLQRAQQDSLTNLYNNETTKYMVNRYLASEGADGIHGLILIDVDDFKSINDTRGHLFGDSVLTAASGRLRALFRSTDILGRIGGDEFMVFLKNVSDRPQLEAQARSILEAFRTSGDAENEITCSIGAALYPEDGGTVDELFKRADIALYRSKKVGKNRYSVYDPAIDVGSGEHTE
ncbi:MAG TPA: diguanylate cyclase [Feifaniaceae bacterium]|nr:diguanylate cyclase [Feifaniaceae bacterium]